MAENHSIGFVLGLDRHVEDVDMVNGDSTLEDPKVKDCHNEWCEIKFKLAPLEAGSLL